MYQDVVQGCKQVQIIHPPAGLHVQHINDVHLLADRFLGPGIQILCRLKGVFAVCGTLPDKQLSSFAAFWALWPCSGYGHVIFLCAWVKWNNILCQQFQKITLFPIIKKPGQTIRSALALWLWRICIILTKVWNFVQS